MKKKLRNVAFATVNLGACLSLMLGSPGQAAPPGTLENDYELIWADEFDEPFAGVFTGTVFSGSCAIPNPSKWKIMQGKRDQAINTPNAFSFQDNPEGGKSLVITTYTVTGTTQTHYTGFLRTEGLFQQPYGYYEARIAFSPERGAWFGFWLQPDDILEHQGTTEDPLDPANDGVEVDIVEHRKVDRLNRCTNPRTNELYANRVHCAIHWNRYGDLQQTKNFDLVPPTPPGDGLPHTYGVEWTPEGYTFYYDGAKLGSRLVTSSTLVTSGSAKASHRPQHVLLTGLLKYGAESGWVGTPPLYGFGDRDLSVTKMTVDYVRVYRMKPSASLQGPSSPPQPFPGTVEAEKHDVGGPDVGYYDGDIVGGPGVVDTATSGSSVYVTATRRSEWLNYTLSTTSGYYLPELRVSNSGTSSGKMRLCQNGVVLGEAVIPPTTGTSAWRTYSAVPLMNIVNSGTDVFRLDFTSGSDANPQIDVDYWKTTYLGGRAILYEAESGTLTSPAEISDLAAASGGAVVSPLGAHPAAVTWTNVDGFDGGNGTLTIRYALTNGTAEKTLVVNGTAVTPAISFCDTAGGSSYVNLQVPVTNLLPGENNTIRLEGTGNSRSIYLDCVIVSQISQTTYEAEAGTLGGTLTVGSAANASGGQMVQSFTATGDTLTWNNVSGLGGGAANLEIRYSRPGSTCKKSLFVNGVRQQLTFDITDKWSSYTTKTVSVSLNEGTSNTISIEKSGVSPADDIKGIHIDRIRVLPAP